LIDEFSKSGLALEIAFSLPAPAVTRVLDEQAAIFGYPVYLRVDNELSVFVKLPNAKRHPPVHQRPEPWTSFVSPRRGKCSYHDDTRSLELSLH
jgi:hypothetical protein